MDELVTTVWGEKGASNETATQRIKLLRKALGDNGQKPQYVSTARNRGFRWLPEVKPHSGNPLGRSKIQYVAAVFAIALLTAMLFLPDTSEPAEQSEL